MLQHWETTFWHADIPHIAIVVVSTVLLAGHGMLPFAQPVQMGTCLVTLAYIQVYLANRSTLPEVLTCITSWQFGPYSSLLIP